jgi:hypothetical protein
MQKHEINKQLLAKFSLDQIHELCKAYKREMNPLDYRDRIILGESDPDIIKRRFISYIAGFFNQTEITEYAKLHDIKLD